MARTAADAQTPRGARRGDEENANGSPDGPTELPKESWFAVLKRTFREFKDDNLTDWAAALTYYGVMALFPMLLVLVSLLGLMGQNTTQTLIDNLGQVAPGAAKDIFTDAIKNLQANQGAAGVMAIVGLVLALWSASGYVAAFMRASNSIYEVEEGRPIWKTAPVRLGTTLVLVILLVICAVAVVFTGPLAQTVGDVIGLGGTFLDVWAIAKWPVLLVIVSFMFALLYWASPNAKQPGFRWISPGGVVGVLLWVAASAAFAFYVANFGSYNKTYGALAGVIIFLVWLWISNVAVLLGAEFNAELERGRRIQEGHPADKEPFVEPRDTRKMSDEGKQEVREAQGPGAVKD
jgi:membrane protein